MNWKMITGIVMIVGIVGWVIWDIIVAANRIPGDTISEITMSIAKAAPIIAVAVGVVAGHLFSDFKFLSSVLSFLGARPLLAFIWGVITGMFFWNQNR